MTMLKQQFAGRANVTLPKPSVEPPKRFILEWKTSGEMRRDAKASNICSLWSKKGYHKNENRKRARDSAAKLKTIQRTETENSAGLSSLSGSESQARPQTHSEEELSQSSQISATIPYTQLRKSKGNSVAVDFTSPPNSLYDVEISEEEESEGHELSRIKPQPVVKAMREKNIKGEKSKIMSSTTRNRKGNDQATVQKKRKARQEVNEPLKKSRAVLPNSESQKKRVSFIENGMLKTIGTREKVLADKLLNRFCKEDKVDGDKRKRRSKKAENIPLDARMSTPLLKLKKLKLVKSNPPAKQEIKRQSRQIAKEWKKLEVKRKPAERRLKLRKANKSESMQNVVRNGRNNPHRINAATPPMKHSCQLFYDSDEDRRQLSCLNRRKNRVGRPIPAYAGCRMPSPKLGRNVYSFTSASPSDSDWFELQSEKGENHWWNRNSAFKRLTFGRVMTEQLTVDSIDMPELPAPAELKLNLPGEIISYPDTPASLIPSITIGQPSKVEISAAKIEGKKKLFSRLRSTENVRPTADSKQTTVAYKCEIIAGECKKSAEENIKRKSSGRFSTEILADANEKSPSMDVMAAVIALKEKQKKELKEFYCQLMNSKDQEKI